MLPGQTSGASAVAAAINGSALSPIIPPPYPPGVAIGSTQPPGLKRESATPLDSPTTATTTTNENTSPVHSHRPTSTGSLVGRKRARDGQSPSESVDDDQSPIGGWNGAGGHNESRIGVKRACNECRQQKLKCNVQQDPFVPCERCKKHKIPCRIDANFKRVGKRKKNAEMEQENGRLRDQLDKKEAELIDLRRQLHTVSSPSGFGPTIAGPPHLGLSNGSDIRLPVPSRMSAVTDLLGTTEAVESLMSIRSGSSPTPTARSYYRIHHFSLPPDKVDDFFQVFFANYHPYLPLMNRTRGPKFFHDSCPLLFWIMMATAMRKAVSPKLLFELDPHLQRLLWATISDVKQHYLVVKALATLCTWPLPVTSSNADPTPMLCGVMVQLAKQIGLHRPSHAQDFERFKVEMRDDELRDRYYTWAACNIVAQRVSTGYGLPPNTLYDWVLTLGEGQEPSFTLSTEVNARLKVEMFCNDVTKSIYTDPTTPLGFIPDEKRQEAVERLDATLNTLMGDMEQEHSVNRLYLLAARLHYHLAVLFDAPEMPNYRSNLDKLWQSTTEFVEAAWNVTSPVEGRIIDYATSYIFQMLLASGFVLLKLLNSFYAHSIERERGCALFSSVVRATRFISVMSNDLPSRFSEVLSQLWQTAGRGVKPVTDQVDDSLQLRVRGRMSMSVVHDSVWRWKEISHVEDDEGARESALSRHTNPDAAPIDIPTTAVFEGRSVSGLGLGPGGAAADSLAVPSSASGGIGGSLGLGSTAMRRSPTPTPVALGVGVGWGDAFANDIFDPTSWMFNGNLDFPINFDSNDISGEIFSTQMG